MTQAATSARPRFTLLLLAGAAAIVALFAATVLVRFGEPLPRMEDGPSLWLVLHLATALPALPLGAWLLWRRKGDRAHRMLGRAWAALMITTALASFGLTGMTGGLSFIHILSALALVGAPRAALAARRGDLAAHRRTVAQLYAGLVAAGLLAFLPGRLLGHWLLG